MKRSDQPARWREARGLLAGGLTRAEVSAYYGICQGTLVAWMSGLRAHEHGVENDKAMRRKRRRERREVATARR